MHPYWRRPQAVFANVVVVDVGDFEVVDGDAVGTLLPQRGGECREFAGRADELVALLELACGNVLTGGNGPEGMLVGRLQRLWSAVRGIELEDPKMIGCSFEGVDDFVFGDLTGGDVPGEYLVALPQGLDGRSAIDTVAHRLVGNGFARTRRDTSQEAG